MVQFRYRASLVSLCLFLAGTLHADRLVEQSDPPKPAAAPGAKPIKKNSSFYMDKVYARVKPADERIRISINNYLIANQQTKASRARLGPQVDASADVGVRKFGGDAQSETHFSRAGISLFQPILSAGRYYDLVLSKQGITSSKLQVSLREEQYLVAYAESLIRISEAKTRYYFAQEKRAFLEKYKQKVEGQQQAAFQAANAGREWNAEKNFAVRSLTYEIERQKRTIAIRKTAVQREINRFRVLILGAEPFPFEKVDNIEQTSPTPQQKKFDLSKYDPRVLREVALPKYILVHPFIERKNIYNNAEESIRLARTNNLNIHLAYMAIAQAQTAVKQGRGLYWPEVGLFASIGGDWSDHSSSAGREFTRSDEAFIGLSIRIPIFDGGARKAQLESAKLKLANAELELDLLKKETAEDASRLHREIKTSVETITSLLEAYRDTKDALSKFLDEEMDEGVTDADKKLLVNDHFEFAEQLALQQHVYLTTTLELLALRRELNLGTLRKLEEDYFVDCNDYDSFLEMSKIVLH